MNINYFNKISQLSQNILNVNILRQGAISNNIANVDTPHYKRKAIVFEAELNRVINQKEEPAFLKTTHIKHFNIKSKKSYLDVKSSVIEEYDTNYRNDKNNVDIEKETSDLVKNSMQYEAVISHINQRFRRLKSVIV